MDFTQFVKFGEVGIAIALITLIYWIVKNFIGFIESKDKRDQEAYCKLSDTIEMYDYLRNRNGSDNSLIREQIIKLMKGKK